VKISIEKLDQLSVNDFVMRLLTKFSYQKFIDFAIFVHTLPTQLHGVNENSLIISVSVVKRREVNRNSKLYEHADILKEEVS